jgi:hypothetical protein
MEVIRGLSCISAERKSVFRLEGWRWSLVRRPAEQIDDPGCANFDASPSAEDDVGLREIEINRTADPNMT